MNHRVLIGLLTASVVAMWGTEASAYNSLGGIIIQHSRPKALILMKGPEARSVLTLEGDALVAILCEKPGNRIFKRKVRHDKTEEFKRTVRVNITQELTNFFLIDTGVWTVFFDPSSAKCPGHLLKVVNLDVYLIEEGPLRCAVWIHDKKACSLTSRQNPAFRRIIRCDPSEKWSMTR